MRTKAAYLEVISKVTSMMQYLNRYIQYRLSYSKATRERESYSKATRVRFERHKIETSIWKTIAGNSSNAG